MIPAHPTHTPLFGGRSIGEPATRRLLASPSRAKALALLNAASVHRRIPFLGDKKLLPKMDI
jgi:hypothetical protein